MNVPRETFQGEGQDRVGMDYRVPAEGCIGLEGLRMNRLRVHTYLGSAPLKRTWRLHHYAGNRALSISAGPIVSLHCGSAARGIFRLSRP